MFAIIQKQYEAEHKEYEDFVTEAKKNPQGKEELKQIWGSFSSMGQCVLEAKHGEIWDEDATAEDGNAEE